jgi:hypothetical protein
MEPLTEDERERFAVSALRPLQRLEAPQRLRARIDAERERSRRPARRRRFALSGALAASAAAVVLALVLALPGGAGGPTVVEAAELGMLSASAPAPRAAGPKLLGASNGGVSFPDWARKFGWEAVGRRADELEGRRVVTVFYEREGRRLAYSIVDGEAVAWPADWRSSLRGGTRYDHRREDGRLVVTWRKGGRTCVLSGWGVELEKTLELADWETTP